MRDRLLELFDSAVARVHGTGVVVEALERESGETAVVALGKAACAMATGAEAAAISVTRGFLCAPRGYCAGPPGPPNWQCHDGGHPLPDAHSLAAGEALVRWLEHLPRGLPLLALMSGGASACIEHLREGMTLDEVIARTRTLLDSGADIRALNAARSEWSELKLGRALRYAGARDVTVLVLSDVLGDDPALVGSGPFHASSPNVTERVIAGNGTAVGAVVGAARAAGLPVTDHGGITGDAARCGRTIAGALKSAGTGLYVWGGECTVSVPANAGRGGRCQHLALSAAIEIDGDPRVTLLVAGTDGIDGDTVDAGAIVDGGTLERMRDAGVDPRRALAAADSNTALAGSGDLVHTGPTGTNVMDLVIAAVE